MIISKTPVRLSFFGGGTDYPEYFLREEGAVLGTTIDKHIYVSVNRLSDFFEYKIRVSYSRAELVNSVDEIIHPSVRETLKYRKITGNLDIHIFADLPARTGLGSSSSFTVGLLCALNALDKKKVTPQQLAEEAVYIEQKLIKENVGCQDQFHAAFGGFNIIEFNKNKIKVRTIDISDTKLKLLNDSMMVFYTGATRYASEILEEQIAKTKNSKNDKSLRQMHQMVYEAEEILKKKGGEGMIEAFGELLGRNWKLKKSLSSKITNDFINEIYDKAVRAGAYGGKLSGAGNGGFIFFLVPQHKKEYVRAVLAPLLEVHFNFEKEGAKIIYES